MDHSRITTILSEAGRPLALKLRRAELVVQQGADAPKKIALAQRLVRIGAHPSNDLVLSDDGVSAFHAQLAVGESGYKLEDHGSANGTFVGDVRINSAILLPGQRFRVGQTTLLVAEGEGDLDLELSEDDFFGELVGRSVRMREVFALAGKVARSSATILINGETGTGKDLLARAIHQHSARAGGAFEIFDCGAVAPSLIESALFGHVQGAFTGAVQDHPGVFERAHGGTVFLDELGELEPSLQPKLLRVLESGRLTRVGGTTEISVDVRTIAATHRDLSAEVDAGRYRSDLYYRIAVVVVRMPALRERPEDIPLLAGHFLRDVLARDEHEVALLRSHLDAAFPRLQRHDWPGNVRELRNVIERAAVLADPAELNKDLFSRLVELRRSIGSTISARPSLQVAREHADIEYLRDALDQSGGDVAQAAKLADIHPKSFSRLLRRYRMDRSGELLDEE